MSSTPLTSALNNRGDGLLDDLGVGAGIIGVDLNLRRRDFRKLGDRKRCQRQRARQHHDDRNDEGELRPIDEKALIISCPPRWSP